MDQIIADIAENITDTSFVVTLLAAFLIASTLITLAQYTFAGDKLGSRLKSVANRRDMLRKQHRASIEKRSVKRNNRSQYSDIVDKLKLENLLEDSNLQSTLLRAGLYGAGPVSTFYFFRFMLPIVLAALSILPIVILNPDWSLQLKIGAVVSATTLGFYIPSIYISNLAKKRTENVMKVFPDALDMILICVESGMTVEAAFSRVGKEVGSASAELAEELMLTTAELSYLSERKDAYENLAKRVDHAGVKAAVTALVQAERYGTPVGEALRVMAKENREMRLTMAEKKAASLPAKLTLPMIMFFLPVLFIVILVPAYVKFTMQ